MKPYIEYPMGWIAEGMNCWGDEWINATTVVLKPNGDYLRGDGVLQNVPEKFTVHVSFLCFQS